MSNFIPMLLSKIKPVVTCVWVTPAQAKGLWALGGLAWPARHPGIGLGVRRVLARGEGVVQTIRMRGARVPAL